MKIKKARAIKVGNSFCFTIPKAFISNGIIDLKKRYDLKIAECKQESNPDLKVVGLES